MPVAVVDAFGRSVTDGWGSADTGGAWTRAGGVAADYDVVSGVGTISNTAAGNRAMTLTSTNVRDVEGTGRVKVDKIPTGTGTGMFVYFLSRISGFIDYRAKVIFFIGGDLRISFSRRSSGGTETSIGPGSVTPTAGGPTTYSADQWIRYRYLIYDNDTGVATMKMRIWADGATEPMGWDNIQTDSSPAEHQISGDYGVALFMSTGVTNGPVLVSFDDINVVSFDSPAPTSRMLVGSAL